MTALQSRELLDALKRAAAALRGAQIPFAVGGGLAAWARGGPPTEHDIDLLIREDDARRALDACAAAGMRTEVPPEGWLVKAWDGEILVDLIFRPTGSIVDDGLFDRCEVLNVQAVRMSVLPVDDILATKLLALTEHNLDYGPVLEYARSLREQIDWETLRRRTDGSPFARAFFALVEQLGVWHGDAARAAGAAEALHAADASALRSLDTDVKVAVTHYSPVEDTLEGERREIYPFLGSYLLAEAVDGCGVVMALHGHAHAGREHGCTPGGTPVRNVAQPVLGVAYKVYVVAS